MKKLTVNDIAGFYRERVPQMIGSYGTYSVLVPLIERDDGIYLLYERRADDLDRQPGEVCFPGGQIEEGETRVECAVRETMEEVGVEKDAIKILAQLDTLNNFNNITMYCFIGTIDYDKLKSAEFSRDEVAELFMVPLDYLMENNPEVYYITLKAVGTEDFPYEKVHFHKKYDWKSGKGEVPIYNYGNQVIWGLTGRITYNLVKQLRAWSQGRDE